jgi:hypothetical protein
VKPVTYRQFTTIIRQLVETGVVERSVWSVGRYGRMSVLKVIEPERVWRELREDLALGEVAERICANVGGHLDVGQFTPSGSTLTRPCITTANSTTNREVSRRGTR